jgi:CP family cyanate transporter-like MFS transporter
MSRTRYAPLARRQQTVRVGVRSHPALLLAGIVLVALNMRAALAALAPLLSEIGRSYRLSGTAGGLLTTLPVLFFGATAPLAPRLSRRWGLERVVLLALLVLAGGVLLRVLPGQGALFGGSVLVGVGIALLNVTVAGLVKRNFAARAAAMTGLYSTVMIFGATIAGAVSVPLEKVFGHGWQGSLGSWAALAALAAVVWLPQALRAPRVGEAGTAERNPLQEEDQEREQPRVRLWRAPLAWQLSTYMGVCSLLAYTFIAWFPTMLTDRGMSSGQAGLVFAFTNLVSLAGAFVVPLLAGRSRDQRGLVAAMIGCYAVGTAGLLAAPVSWAWLIALPLGFALGGAFALALAMIVLRAPNAAVTAELSGMSQLIGYLIAALGPVGVGALRGVTGGWTVPLALLLAVCAVGLSAGLGAARDVKLR